jgi:hypothetical protein
MASFSGHTIASDIRIQGVPVTGVDTDGGAVREG